MRPVTETDFETQVLEAGVNVFFISHVLDPHKHNRFRDGRYSEPSSDDHNDDHDEKQVVS